jgi:hypothetical protein
MINTITSVVTNQLQVELSRKYRGQQLVHEGGRPTLGTACLISTGVLKIQSTWRSYIIRRKVAKLFLPLPRELQIRVLWYVNKDHYIKHIYIPSIFGVYQRRLRLIRRRMLTLLNDYKSVNRDLINEEISTLDYRCRIVQLNNCRRRLELNARCIDLKLIQFKNNMRT